jgi:hypothetical protein
MDRSVALASTPKQSGSGRKRAYRLSLISKRVEMRSAI